MSTKTASKSYPFRGGYNPVSNPGAPDRKAKKKLDARVEDYAKMVSGQGWRAPDGAYHQSGSMQR